MQQGAAQPHVYPKQLACLNLVVPSGAVLRRFKESVESNFYLIANLDIQNQKIAQAHDFLLPRLMNGEVGI